MSAIRKRQQIQSVALQIATAQLPLSSQAALQTQVALSQSAQTVLQQVQQTLPAISATLTSVQACRQTAQTLQQQSIHLAQQAQLSLVETTQVMALATAAAYSTQSPEALQLAWNGLQQSGQSPASVQTALQQFTHTLESEHQQVMAEQLKLACTQAALQIGFQPLQSTVAVNGTLRILASDDTGRTLVTEISSNADQEVAMATELIGSSDASCEQILNAFDQALEAVGVKSGPPERKFTGGICELAAAQEFVQQRPQRRPGPTPAQPAKKPQTRHQQPQTNRLQH